MAECYPQGCPPCDGPIEFPENPVNGQRYCINIGLDPNTQENIHKCWVYDHCIPGWRAEGPTVSPINFKGGVDLTLTPAGNNISDPEAGDYYIVEVGSADVSNVPAQDWLNNYWASLVHEVPKGSFIMWSGTEWVEVPRPCAEIVQSDWLQTDENEPDYILNKPEFPGIIGNADGGVMTTEESELSPARCGDSPVTFTVEAKPVSSDGNPVVGIFEYKWETSADNLVWAEISTEISYQRKSSLTISPAADQIYFRCAVQFTDLYGNTLINTSEVFQPVLGSVAFITAQPVTLDLTTDTTGDFSVDYDNSNPNPTQTYAWYINGREITEATIPNVGYTFANWTTHTLDVVRDEATAGSYTIQLRITNNSDCNPILYSDAVFLKGPGGLDGAAFPVPLFSEVD